MLEHVCHLHATVHFRPSTMHVQSFDRETRAHLHDNKMRTTSGAGDSCHGIDHEAAIFNWRPSMAMPLAGVRSFRRIYSLSPYGRMLVCLTHVLFERVIAWWTLCRFDTPSSTAELLIPEFIAFFELHIPLWCHSQSMGVVHTVLCIDPAPVQQPV